MSLPVFFIYFSKNKSFNWVFLQNEWVNSFYKQNGYLEYDALSRLGIMDHKIYIKKQLANEKLQYLNSCIISQNILDQVEANIEECIASKSYVDLQSNLPSVFNDKDIEKILDIILTNQIRSQIIIIEDYLISKAFIEKISKNCEDLVKDKAKAAVDCGKYQQYKITSQSAHLKAHKIEEVEEKVDKREERRKKASGGKSGGGTQGRETKTKSVKKVYKTGNKNVDLEEVDVPEKKSFEVLEAEDIKGDLYIINIM